MGRERYRHYAAQRLARASVDRLLSGHLQPSSNASGEVQLNGLVDSQWATITRRLGLPASWDAPSVNGWFTTVAFPLAEIRALSRQVMESEVLGIIPSPGGQDAHQWLAGLQGLLGSRRQRLAAASANTAYRWAYGWAPALEARIVAEVGFALAQFGIPYARAVLERLEGVISDQLLPRMVALSQIQVGDPATIPAQFEQQVVGIRGVITNGRRCSTSSWS